MLGTAYLGVSRVNYRSSGKLEVEILCKEEPGSEKIDAGTVDAQEEDEEEWLAQQRLSHALLPRLAHSTRLC